MRYSSSGRHIVLMVVCALACLAQPASANNAAKIWKLDYRQIGLSVADVTVYLGGDSVKIVTTSGYVVTAGAPKWTTLVADKSRKMACELAISQWRNGFWMERSGSEEELNPKYAASDEQTDYRGIKARRLTWKRVESDDLYRERSAPRQVTDELIVSRDIPCSKEELELISAWFGIPHLTGMPLLLQQQSIKGKELKLKLLTVGMISRDSVSFTAHTTGYRRVKKMHDMLDDNLKGTVTDFMKEFQGGFDRK